MITALVLLAALAAPPALPPAPLLAVLDVPGAQLADERLVAPEVPAAPVAPVAPRSSETNEAVWGTYREAQAAYEAARAARDQLAAARKEAERAARDAGRARGGADRAASSAAYSVESAVRRTKGFEVATARTVRGALGAKLDGLHGCRDAACSAEVFTASRARYVLIVLGEVEAADAAPVLTLVLLRSAASPEVLAQREVADAGTLRTVVPELLAPALAFERDATYAEASRAADGLDWERALAWIDRCLTIAPQDGPAQYLAGRIFFALGDLSSADRRLNEAIAGGTEVGEASHLLALGALRRRRDADAAVHFARAVQNGKDTFEARLTLGRAAAAADPAGAIAHLRKAIELRPNHGEASFLLGGLLLAAGDGAGEDLLRRAIAADFRAGDAHFDLGGRDLARGDPAAAAAHYDAAWDLGRTTPEALLVLGRQVLPINPGRAAAALNEARRRGLRSDEVDFLLGKASLASGDSGAALRALLRAVLSERFAADARLLIAESYVKADNVPMAALHFKAAIDLGRDSYASRMVLARAALLARDTAGAQAAYAAALGLSPKDGPASLGLGMALVALKRPAEAVPHLEVAVAANQSKAEALLLLGRIAGDRGDRAAQRTHFAAAAAAGSREPEVYRVLAASENAARHADAAVQHWAKVLELVPGDGEASFELGLLHATAGRAAAALPLLQHAATSATYRGRAHRLLGELAVQQQQAEQALQHLEEAAKSLDPDYELMAKSGWAAQELGLDDRARQYLLRALAFRPADGAVMFRLGEVNQHSGAVAQALAFYRRAAAAGHRAEEAKARVRQLEAAPPAAP